MNLENVFVLGMFIFSSLFSYKRGYQHGVRFGLDKIIDRMNE